MGFNLDQLPVACGCFDIHCNLIAANERWISLFGIEDVVSFRKLLTTCQPCGASTADFLSRHIQEAKKEGSCQFELYIEKLGQQVCLDICIQYSSADSIIVCAHNISFYKTTLDTALERAHESNEINEVLIDSAPFIINVWDDALNLVTTSNQAAKMFGFENKMQYIERFNELSPEFQPCGTPTSEKIVRLLNEAFEHGYAHFEWMHQTVSGEPLPSEITLVRFMRQNRYMLVAYASDLRPIKTAMAKVQQSYETSQMFIDSAPFFVEIWDSNFDLIECNQTALKMFEITDNEEYVKIFRDLSPEYQPCGTSSKEKIRTVIETAFREGYLHTDWMHIAPNGEPLPVDVTYVRLKRGDEDIVVGYNVDLRDAKLRQMAEDANKAKSTFLSTMSHEIRTPMNAILGITEIQLMNADIDPEIKEAFEKIYTSGDLLLSIINDILDLSKIEAGKLDLIVSKYEIASFISDTAQLNMMRIGSKQIEFEINVDEHMPTHVLGDELRVKQILNNLLSNAFKYTQKGNVTLSVSSHPGTSKEKIVLVIAVRDTGNGMTKEQVSQLFDEYARFNEATNRSTEGTGLGMSITNNLIKLMDGEIFVESEPGKGSVFTVHLPQGDAGTDKLGKETVENLRQFRTSSRAQMRRVQITREPMPYGKVLIVDDVETNIFVAKGLLVPYKLKIDSASSGLSAIKKIENGNVYDIIFMDHMMPDMDGIETAKHLRSMGYDKPIVALTANVIVGQAAVFLESGFDDFLSKPIDVRNLNMVLNKLVRDRYPKKVVEEARAHQQIEKNTKSDVYQQRIDPKFTESFVRDAKKSLEVLTLIDAKGGPSNSSDLRTYVIHVHGIKSALANAKNMKLSTIAARLEKLGREEKLEDIIAETPAFLDALRIFSDEITPKTPTAGKPTIITDEDVPYLHEKLLSIKISCEEYDEVIVEEVLAELKSKTWSQPTTELIDAVSRHLLLSEFDEIIDDIDKYLDS